MTVKPTGLPIWAAPPDITTYGGDINKQNLGGIGPIDPTTDESAEDFSSQVDHTQAMAHTSDFCLMVYQADDVHSTDGYILSYRSQPSVGTSFAPTPHRVTAGEYQFTWLASYSDSYGQSASLAIQEVTATCQGSTAGSCTYVINSANVVTIYVWNGTSAKSNATFTLRIGVGSST